MKNRVPKDYQDKILVHSLPVFFLGLSIFYIVPGISNTHLVLTSTLWNGTMGLVLI